MKENRVKIKYSLLVELMRNIWADEYLKEARKTGPIDVVDNVTGQKIGELDIKLDDDIKETE